MLYNFNLLYRVTSTLWLKAIYIYIYFSTYLNFLLATYRIVNQLHFKTLSQFLGKIVVVNKVIKKQANKIFSSICDKNCQIFDLLTKGLVFTYLNLQVNRFFAIKYLHGRWAWLDRVANTWKSWTDTQNLDKISSLCHENQTIHFWWMNRCLIEEYSFRARVRFIRNWCWFT